MKPRLKPQPFSVQMSDCDTRRVLAVLDLLTFLWTPGNPEFAALDHKLLRDIGLSSILRETYSGEYSGIPCDSYIQRVATDVDASFADIMQIALAAPKVWVAVEQGTAFPRAFPVWHGSAFFPTRDVWLDSSRVSEPSTKIVIADVPNEAAAAVLIAECSHRGEAGPEMQAFAKLICQKLRIVGEPRTMPQVSNKCN